jgi:hypothetical protein
MAERIFPLDKERDLLVAEFEVEYENVFHLKWFYKHCYEWFQMWNYESADGTGEPESLYLEKITYLGTTEHQIWWRFRKKINKFVKYYIKFDIQTLNSSQVEIMHQGKKTKSNSTDIIFRVKSYAMFDYQGDFSNNSLLKQFDRIFRRRWYRQETEMHRKQLWFETYNLEDFMKQYLEINTGTELPDAFHPNKGL